jgi:acetolactate synthase I/II/III large subunit
MSSENGEISTASAVAGCLKDRNVDTVFTLSGFRFVRGTVSGFVRSGFISGSRTVRLLRNGTGLQLGSCLSGARSKRSETFRRWSDRILFGRLRFVRHRVNVTAVIGNNGIWGLEKHPMEMFFGYSVCADLGDNTRYDLVAEALGGHGEYVERPTEIGPALDRAFEFEGLSVVNIQTDPKDSCPRRSSLT